MYWAEKNMGKVDTMMAPYMFEKKAGLSELLDKLNPFILYTHCYGNAINLEVKATNVR